MQRVDEWKKKKKKKKKKKRKTPRVAPKKLRELVTFEKDFMINKHTTLLAKVGSASFVTQVETVKNAAHQKPKKNHCFIGSTERSEKAVPIRKAPRSLELPQLRAEGGWVFQRGRLVWVLGKSGPLSWGISL